MPRILGRLLPALPAAALVLLACRGVAVYPGLHGDEGWIGRYALAVISQGAFSPHEMNTYTGPVYGWLLALLFSFVKPGVLALRLPGLLLNLLAAGLMALHLRRRFGRESALAWLVLLCGSALFLLKSRVAWEVYALQPLVLVGVMILARHVVEPEAPSRAAAWGFLALNFFGTLNHFIFLCVPISLLLAALANALFLEDRRTAFLRLCAVNLLMCAALCLVKPRLTDAFWLAHRPALLGAALLFPAACVLPARAGGWADRLPAAAPPWAGRALLAALGLGLALFFVYHWAALIEIVSGVAVFQRLGSWAPAAWQAAPLYAWAAVLLCSYLHYALSRLSAGAAARLAPYERLLAFWPLACMACFILLRNTSSIRYYVVPIWLLTASLAAVLPRLPAWRRPALLLPMLAGAAFVYGFAWRETAGPSTRRPTRFYVSWHIERSIDFADNTALARVAREQRICNFIRQDSFTDMPLIFLSGALPPGGCDQSKALWTEYCRDCSRPPYIDWKVVGRP